MKVIADIITNSNVRQRIAITRAAAYALPSSI